MAENGKLGDPLDLFGASVLQLLIDILAEYTLSFTMKKRLRSPGTLHSTSPSKTVYENWLYPSCLPFPLLSFYETPLNQGGRC